MAYQEFAQTALNGLLKGEAISASSFEDLFKGSQIQQAGFVKGFQKSLPQNVQDALEKAQTLTLELTGKKYQDAELKIGVRFKSSARTIFTDTLDMAKVDETFTFVGANLVDIIAAGLEQAIMHRDEGEGRTSPHSSQMSRKYNGGEGRGGPA